MQTNAPERLDVLLVTTEPFNAEIPPKALQAPITATTHHYVRSHFPAPQHDGTLTVDGVVDYPLTLTLNDLLALQATTLCVTLECAGNGRLGFQPLPRGEPWGWGAVSTAMWTGVPLEVVLALAHPRPEGYAVLFEGADHGSHEGHPDAPYTRALTLAEIQPLGEDILLAYMMNGEPLTPDHGAPFRLIAPTWYGMASVKWLRHIRVVTTPYQGQFQTDSYVYRWTDGSQEPVTTMRIRAQVTDPLPGTVLARGTHTIRGKAWSGAGTITAVEIKIDSQDVWQPALLAPPGGQYAWQEWAFDWNVTEVGRHVIQARAHDSTGTVQPDQPAWNKLGYGNNAIQPCIVDVH